MARPSSKATKPAGENEAPEANDYPMVRQNMFSYKPETRDEFVRRIAEQVLLDAIKIGTNYKMLDIPQIAVKHARLLADELGIVE